jgi:hypothetical protein
MPKASSLGLSLTRQHAGFSTAELKKRRRRDEAVAAFDTHTLRSPSQAEWKW